MPSLTVLAQLLGLWLLAGATGWAWFVTAGFRFEALGDASAETQGALASLTRARGMSAPTG